MSENTYKPRNYRVVRHVTKNRILDIQDCLDIDKLRIEIVDFVEGEGAKLSVEHFAEPDALALVCYDILQGRPWDKYVEFKGTMQGETTTSRVLVIERVEARNPVKITVSRGPGKVMGQGAIQPLGKPEASLSMLLSEFDARRIAFTVLRHLAAYEAANYHARVAAGTRHVEAEPEAGAAPQPPAPTPVANPLPAVAAATRPAAKPVAEPAAHPVAQPLAEPEPIAQAAAAGALRPAPRRAPAVESYWMAAERLGIARAEAESILQGVNGDWGRAWSILRSREQHGAERN